jgi:class 3 adenylate cyclase/tetratricopeptide (TPR) repeat protein
VDQDAEDYAVSAHTPDPKSYTPRHLAQKILKGRSKIQGEKKNVTVLFADVAGYTDIAQRVGPERSHTILAGCFDILTMCVHHFEGTINQYTGDGIMALFGAPIAHENHPFRALESVLLMRDQLKRYAGTLKEEEKIDFAMRFGINTGPVVVGAIGDDLRLDYTAVGDTTNQAARLQQMAEPGQILVSEHTERLIRGLFTFRTIGKVVLKGKTTPLNVLELLARSSVKTRLEAQELRGLNPFQGRAKELSLLASLADSAKKRTGHTISITGQAGIGKSRLLMEALRPLSDVVCFECRCAHFAQNIPYFPFIELFKTLDASESEDRFADVIDNPDASGQPGRNGEISQLMVACRQLLLPDDLDLSRRPNPSPEIKARISETMKRLFVACSQRKPLFLIVEDMHWIDKHSEEFLLFLVDSMRRQKLILVTLHRPEYQPPWDDRSHYDRLNLTSLTELESRALVDELAGDYLIPEADRDEIVQQANGIPFFLEELTRLMIEKEGTNGSLSGSDIHIPASIQDLIAARIDRLDDKEKQIIQAASVLGPEFQFNVLKRMLWDMDGLKEGLQNLQAKELIFEKNLFPELEYEFTNTLIQEVTYRGILEEDCAELHHHAGHAIETIFADALSTQYGMLSHHFSQTHDEASALKYLWLSAIRAYSVYAHREAIEKFDLALELADRRNEGKEALGTRIDLRLDYGAQLMRLKGQTERDFFDIMKEAETLSLLLQDKEREADVKILVSSYQVLEGMFSEAEGIASEILAACEETGNQEQLGAAYRLLHLCAFHKGDVESAMRYGRAQIELQERIGFQEGTSSKVMDEYISTCGSMAVLVLLKGEREDAWELFEKGKELAEQAGDPALLAHIRADQGWLLMMEGDSENAARCVRESLNVLEELGMTVFLPALHMLNGIVLSMTGDWSGGREQIVLGYREAFENKVLFTFVWYGILAIGILETAQPGDPLAREIKGKLSEMTASMGTPFYECMVRHLEGELLIGSNPVLAEQALHESMETFRALGIQYMTAHVQASLAQCQTKLNKIKEADANLQEAKALYAGMGLPDLIDLFESILIRA